MINYNIILFSTLSSKIFTIELLSYGIESIGNIDLMDRESLWSHRWFWENWNGSKKKSIFFEILLNGKKFELNCDHRSDPNRASQFYKQCKINLKISESICWRQMFSQQQMTYTYVHRAHIHHIRTSAMNAHIYPYSLWIARVPVAAEANRFGYCCRSSVLNYCEFDQCRNMCNISCYGGCGLVFIRSMIWAWFFFSFIFIWLYSFSVHHHPFGVEFFCHLCCWEFELVIGIHFEIMKL